LVALNRNRFQLFVRFSFTMYYCTKKRWIMTVVATEKPIRNG